MISGVDITIGRIRDELKKLNFDGNTIIIVMGDNGYFLGERGFGGKFLLYESSLRVPLIIYDPGNIVSKRSIILRQKVLNIDIAPTILEMAGIDIPEDMQGISLMPLLNGEESEFRTEFLCENLIKVFPSILRTEGYRTERWKYLHYNDISNSDELYDLENDPMEEFNLVNDPKYRKKFYELRRLCEHTINESMKAKLTIPD